MSTTQPFSDSEERSKQNFNVYETLDDEDEKDRKNNNDDTESSYEEEEDIDLKELEKRFVDEAKAYLYSNATDDDEDDDEDRNAPPPPPDPPFVERYDARTGNYIRQRSTVSSLSSTTTRTNDKESTNNYRSSTSTAYSNSRTVKENTRNNGTSNSSISSGVPSDPKKRAEELQRLQKQTEMMGSLITLTGIILIFTIGIVFLGNNNFIPSWFTSSSSPFSRSGISHHSSHHHNQHQQYTTLSGQIYPIRGKHYTESNHPSGRKLQDTELFIKPTYEQLYQQSIVNITYGHTVLCSTCHGTGGTGIRTCPQCHGQRIQVFVHRMGNMIQQVQRECDHCHGEGRIIEHVCDTCHGKGHHYETITLPVRLSGGLQHNDIIRIPQYGDQHRDVGYGDLLVRIEENSVIKVVPVTENCKYTSRSSSSTSSLSKLSKYRERDTNIYSFQRRKMMGDNSNNEQRTIQTRNDDFEGKIKITLQEALFGFNRTYLHPGNLQQKIHISSTTPVQPGQILIIKHAGMPRRPAEAVDYQYTKEDGRIIEQQIASTTSSSSLPVYTITDYGDAYIEVQVQLPETLRTEEEETIRRVF